LKLKKNLEFTKSRGLKTKIHSHDVTNHQLGCFVYFFLKNFGDPKDLLTAPRFGHPTPIGIPTPHLRTPKNEKTSKPAMLYLNLQKYRVLNKLNIKAWTILNKPI